MLGWLKRREGAQLAVLGLFVAAALFVAVNVLADRTLGGAQADLTENHLYSLSDGTKATLADLQEPIQVRLYYSRAMGETLPVYGAYFDRVRELLERYVALSNGTLQLRVLDPEPFSDAEDQAVADGLQGVPLSQSGDVAYFGLAATNAVDGHAVIPFFNLERESFLEYDLTKLILGLSQTEKPTIATINGLPPAPHPQTPGMEAPTAASPRPIVLDQLREFFTVLEIPPDAAAIPETAKGLLVMDVNGVSNQTVLAIDRFVHDGGSALLLIDPVLESGRRPLVPGPNIAEAEKITQLLTAWGVRLVEGKVAADLDSSRQVSSGATVSDYPVWMSLSRPAFDEDDPIMAGIERINIASAGFFEPTADATTTMSPLIRTGLRSMAIDSMRIRFAPDFEGLLRDYKPGGVPLTIAARVKGPAKLAFPGSPESAGTAPINVVLVADADLIYDRFWVQSGDFFGQQMVVPIANNGDFIINSFENLLGGRSLAGLRGRGTSYRPFTLVEELRRDAEMQYRSKEQALQEQLRDLQQRMESIGRQQGGQAQIVLSVEDRSALEKFRSETLAVRKQLRDVQLALRQEIDAVENRVKAVNIAAVPVLLVVVAVVVLLWRRSRAAGRAGPS